MPFTNILDDKITIHDYNNLKIDPNIVEKFKENKRDAVIKQLEKIKKAKNCLNLINSLEIGDIYQIALSLRIYDEKTKLYVKKDISLIIIPTKLNQESFNGTLLASNYIYYKVKNILEGYVNEYKALKYMQIINIKKWDKKEAPFCINWEYLSDEYKQLAFNSK